MLEERAFTLGMRCEEVRGEDENFLKSELSYIVAGLFPKRFHPYPLTHFLSLTQIDGKTEEQSTGQKQQERYELCFIILRGNHG